MHTSARFAGTSAIRIADLVGSGAVSPLDVVEDHLARISELDGELHAFQVVRAERARAEAAMLARRFDLNHLPLAGVPVAVKDNIDVAGEPTRHGSAATSSSVATADDELVRRLRDAGAIVIGKTTMPEFAIWGFTESAAYGVTRNPWDPARSPGGSTGGGAVAVSAGMAALALGSDCGGSLRIPAAYCGLVGFKPATGVIPIAGGAAQHWYGLTVFGPIAATVADAALAVDVLAGRSPQPVGGAPRPLRIGVLVKSPSPPSTLHAVMRVAVQSAVAQLEAGGHAVTPAHKRYPAQLIPWWERRWFAGIAEDAERLAAGRFDQLEPRTRTMVRRGRLLLRTGGPRPGPATRWRAKAAQWFDDFDVLLTPMVATPAPQAGTMTGRGYLGTLLPAAKGIPYGQAWNLAGFPAISMPVGLDEAGMPVAVQLVAPPGREHLLLSLAQELEQVNG
ncbi:MAG TPA: amidase family protein [Jatrophihabitans sp.]